MEGKFFTQFIWWIKENSGIRIADCVISANIERGKILSLRYPKIQNSVVIENYPHLSIGQTNDYISDRDSIRKELNISRDDMVFIFQGSLNKNRGLEKLHEALSHFKQLNNKKFIIIGDGNYRKKFEELITSSGHRNNFHFTGKVDYKQLPRYMVAGDIGLLYFPPKCLNYIFAAPNKLYEYMLNRMAIFNK